MNANRKIAFRAWMLSPESPYYASAASTDRYIEKIEEIQDKLRLTLDAEFERDGLEYLNEGLKNCTARDHPHKRSMGWTAITPDGTIDGYSTCVIHYKVFREDPSTD